MYKRSSCVLIALYCRWLLLSLPKFEWVHLKRTFLDFLSIPYLSGYYLGGIITLGKERNRRKLQVLQVRLHICMYDFDSPPSCNGIMLDDTIVISSFMCYLYIWWTGKIDFLFHIYHNLSLQIANCSLSIEDITFIS